MNDLCISAEKPIKEKIKIKHKPPINKKKCLHVNQINHLKRVQ